MLITKGGIIIRTPVKGISVLKRSATGVKIMDVMDSVAGIAKVVGEDEEDDNMSDEGYDEISGDNTSAEISSETSYDESDETSGEILKDNISGTISEDDRKE